MAVDGLNMEGGTGVEDFREVFAEFLGGHVNLQLVVSAMQELLAADPGQADFVQQQLDAALQTGQLPEQTWERLTAELDHLAANEEPTEWSVDMAGPQFAGLEGDDRPDEEPTQPPTPKASEASTDEGLRPGTLLQDRYVLVSAVSGGAMGTVYKALDRRRKEAGDPHPWVAVKLTGADFASNPAAVAALENEVALCSRLNHPAIVRVHGLEQHDGQPFIVMDWLDGDTLAALFRRHPGPLPAAQSISILRDICDALEHAHAAGIVHADVKPANVFVTHAGHAKLIDFGIARLLDADAGQFDAASLGARTPAWASCEVLEGAAVERRDEVFALGLLAYRLFAGRRPFGELSALDAEAAGLAAEPPPGLASHRWQALAAALAFRREQRPESVAAFRDAFFAPAPASERSEPAVEPVADDGEEIVLETVAAPASSLESLASTETAATSAEPPPKPADDDTTINPALAPAPALRPWQRRRVQVVAAVLVVGLATVLAMSQLREPAPSAASRVSAKPAESAPPATVAEQQPGKQRAGAAPESATLQPIELTVARLALPDGPDTEAGGSPATVTDEPAFQGTATAGAPADSAAPGTALPAPASPPDEAAPPVAETSRRAAVGQARPARPAEATPSPIPSPESPPTAPRETTVAAPPKPPERPATAAASAERPAPETVAANSPATTGPAATSQPAGADQDPATAAPAESTQALVASTAGMAMLPPDTSAVPPAEAIGPPPPMRRKPQPPPDEIGPLPPPGPDRVALSALDFRRFVEPSYPRELAARGVEGWVELEFRVNEKGEVENARVTASEPAGVFDEAALKAVGRWRFKPYRVDGEATTIDSQVRLRFEE